MAQLFPISLPEWVIAVYSLFDTDINQADSWKLNALHDWRRFSLHHYRINSFTYTKFNQDNNNCLSFKIHRDWRCNVAVMKRSNASFTELGFLLIKAGLLDARMHLIEGWNFADSLALCRKRGPVVADWKMQRRPFYFKLN